MEENEEKEEKNREGINIELPLRFSFFSSLSPLPSLLPFFPPSSRINFLSTKFLLLRIHLHVISEQLIVSIIGGRTPGTDARKLCFNINFLSLILAGVDGKICRSHHLYLPRVRVQTCIGETSRSNILRSLRRCKYRVSLWGYVATCRAN